ncbi:MAG: type III pantothenate kinase [Eubacteriaceae bacterium]|nr:type III pantothenate kinase [Eubacteriaceae bacterium]
MHILAVDVGNTTTEFGLYSDDELLTSYRFITKQERTMDEAAFFVRDFLELHSLTFSDIGDAILSSVVPNINQTLINMFRKYMNVDPMVVGPGIKTGINVATANPREVGADRIVDALAAYEIYGGPVIVVNYGTATRYDYVDADGQFKYAVTSPGIKISADALWTKAAKLPEIEIAKPDTILVNNTITSMQAGLVYGCIGQTEYIVRQMRKETGTEAKTVVAGGYAPIIMPHTDVLDIYDPLLTMKGLKLLYDKNRH